MQAHFNEVILSRFEQVNDEAGYMETRGDQNIVLQTIILRALGEREILFGNTNMVVTASSEHPRHIFLILKDDIAPNGRKREVEELVESVCHFVYAQFMHFHIGLLFAKDLGNGFESRSEYVDLCGDEENCRDECNPCISNLGILITWWLILKSPLSDVVAVNCER